MFKNLLSSIRKDLHHHVKSAVLTLLVVLGITVLSGNVPGSVFVALSSVPPRSPRSTT